MAQAHRLLREVVGMKFYYITFRSVTYAQRAEQLLRDAGHHCSLQRTPRWMEAQGCGYALRVWTGQIQPSVQLLRQERIPIRRLYIQGSDGQLEELTL